MSQSRKLRILTIIPYFAPAWAYGGPVRVAYEITQRLAARGHTMTVLTTDALDATARAPQKREVIDGVDVHRFPNWSNWLAWRRLFLSRGLRGVLKADMSEVDVVHLHEFRSSLNAQSISMLSHNRVPFVVSPHGGMPLLGRAAPKRVYDALFGDRLLREATRFHAITSMEHDQLTERGVETGQIALIPNGIDASHYACQVDVAAFKQKYDLAEGHPVIGYVARLNAIKGPDVLVGTFARVVQALPDALLMLAGPDDGMQPTLEAQIKQLGLEKCVRFTGYLSGDEHIAAYHASDVYVLPSRYDIFGITVLEALLTRTPIIVSDRCGLADTVNDANLGRVTPAEDPEALAQQIIAVLTNSEAAQRQADHARAYVLDHYQWDTIADQWETLYREVAGERAL